MGSISRRQILEMVRQIVITEIADYPVKVYLFGSWARGEERVSSDIDIAVERSGGVPMELITRLRDALEESIVPYRIDVVDMTEATQELINKVRKEGILWKG